MSARGPVLLLALCAACAPSAGGQTPAPEMSPAHVQTGHVRSYLDAFNTGRPEVLAPAFVDTLSSPPIVWSRGTVSRGWVGHQLFLDDRGQATRHSIWRARPGEATGFLVFQRFLELVANDRSPRPADPAREPRPFPSSRDHLQ